MIEKGDTPPKDRYLIGGANNLLISPNPPPLMMLSKDFATIYHQDNILSIGASMLSNRIFSYTKKHNIRGFEFCSKLPGMLGGLLAMNAGVKEYEIFNNLHSIKIDGVWIKRDDIEYGYRFANLQGIATEARFYIEYGFNQTLVDELASLRTNQPKDPSAGSAFKNPHGDYAGRLIEAVGLKGTTKGNMGWSEVHSNFLVNFGGGRFEDAKYLIDLAKSKVFDTFGILLEEEIKIL